MKSNDDKVPGIRKTTARRKVVEAQVQLDKLAKVDDQEYQRRVSAKAYELYARRGYKHGYHLEDWTQAERIIREGLE